MKEIRIVHETIGQFTQAHVYVNGHYRGKLVLEQADFKAIDDMLFVGAENTQHFYVEEEVENEGLNNNNS